MRGGYDENIGYTKVQYHSQSGCECWKEKKKFFVCWYLRSSHVETGSFTRVWIALSESDHFPSSCWKFGGSPDNALLGSNIRWKLNSRNTVYAQLMLDEFLLAEVRAGNGWWANKQAFQLGYKSSNLFVKQLNLQTEFNFVRPFTYSHRSNSQNYSNANQPLAHPLGSDFVESVSLSTTDGKYFRGTENPIWEEIPAARILKWYFHDMKAITVNMETACSRVWAALNSVEFRMITSWIQNEFQYWTGSSKPTI